MTWYMRIGTGVRAPAGATTVADASSARTDAEATTVEPSASVESEAAKAASAFASEDVREVVMAGTVGGASNRLATGD